MRLRRGWSSGATAPLLPSWDQRLFRVQTAEHSRNANDGGTVFQPEIAPEFDAAIETGDPQTMDQRLMAGAPSGDSRTGCHLFAQLRATGVEMRAAGSSDWVVFAGSNGYAADEAYFLHCIIHSWTCWDTCPRLMGRPRLSS